VKFALFYEIPVARPWLPDSEHRAYKNTLEQAIAGEQAGFHAFWTVEHHFLEEYSHCSNPEVLYGAIASRTSKMRLGYGVRLMPKPYNHPVRTAESVAVLDLLSDGRVDFGTGRSATRIELEGFGIDPKDSREMWREAIEHVVGCWTNDRYSFEGKHWSLPDRRVQPKPLQQPHPPIWVGGISPAALRRVIALGDGWHAMSSKSPAELAASVAELKRLAAAAGRAWNTIEVSMRFEMSEAVLAGGVQAVVDRLGEYARAGVQHVAVVFRREDPKRMMELLDLVASKVRPALAG